MQRSLLVPIAVASALNVSPAAVDLLQQAAYPTIRSWSRVLNAAPRCIDSFGYSTFAHHLSRSHIASPFSARVPRNSWLGVVRSTLLYSRCLRSKTIILDFTHAAHRLCFVPAAFLPTRFYCRIHLSSKPNNPTQLPSLPYILGPLQRRSSATSLRA